MPSLIIALATLLLTTSCAPTSSAPATVAPTTMSASEFLPGFRLKAGSVLRYQQQLRATVAVPGLSVPEFKEKNTLTMEVLSVDRQGTLRVRLDIGGKPYALVRYRANGEFLDAQPLTSEAGRDVEEMASLLKGVTWDRPVRVGDNFPFKQRVAKVPGFDQPADVVGTMVFTGLSTTGRCRTAEFQGSLRLDSQRPLELVDQKSGRRFHVEITGSIWSKYEAQTGALFDAHSVLTFNVSEAGGYRRGQITVEVELRLDSRSFGTIGCDPVLFR